MNKILIADDEECLLLAYKKLLSGPGVEIDTTQSAAEAQELLSSNSYSVVIVDLRLAGSAEMEGIDIITAARRLYPDCKIIVLTAYGDHRIKESVINAGATHFLEKPISALMVRELLNNFEIYSNGNVHPVSI
jgi:two-component system response regulator PilR (NtrC family)